MGRRRPEGGKIVEDAAVIGRLGTGVLLLVETLFLSSRCLELSLSPVLVAQERCVSGTCHEMWDVAVAMAEPLFPSKGGIKLVLTPRIVGLVLSM